MKKNIRPLTRNLIVCALCMALCAVLPLAFHAIPDGGSIFSPIHIPVLLCGLVCGAPTGALCGVGGVLLASITTGMPPMGYVPPMLLECAVYGCVTGLMCRVVRTKSTALGVYVPLLCAMLAGRIAAGAFKAFLFAPGSMTFGVFVTSYFITSLPGIVLQLLLIPPVVIALRRAGIVTDA